MAPHGVERPQELRVHKARIRQLCVQLFDPLTVSSGGGHEGRPLQLIQLLGLPVVERLRATQRDRAQLLHECGLLEEGGRQAELRRPEPGTGVDTQGRGGDGSCCGREEGRVGDRSREPERPHGGSAAETETEEAGAARPWRRVERVGLMTAGVVQYGKRL
jgi:hypothetical protein